MSGTMQFRVNRSWLNATNPGEMNNRVFGELLAFFADHPNFLIVSYGTGKSETGTETPASWLAWTNTDGSGAVPWGEQSWIVVEAIAASATLNGDGSRPWQAKFQVSNLAGFDDCNVADADYRHEADTGIVCMRFSPDGGWVGASTCDFVAVTASDNFRVCDVPAADRAFYLHIMGDDDTVTWLGQVDNDGVLPTYSQQRMTLIGETVRRSSAHLKPEVAIVSRLADLGATTAHTVGKGFAEGDRYIFTASSGYNSVPSFSLAADGSAVEGHRIDGSSSSFTTHRLNAHNLLAWQTGPDPWTGEDEAQGILIRQDKANHRSLIGQLRLYVSLDDRVAEGSLTGDGDYLSCAFDTAVDGGIGVVWPGSGTAPLF